MFELNEYQDIINKCQKIAIMFLKSEKLWELLIEYQAEHDLPISLLYRYYETSIDCIHACVLSIYRNVHVFN